MSDLNLIVSIIASLFVSVGIYLVLHRSVINILMGLGLLTHATNLLILVMSGSPIGKSAPIVLDSGAQVYVDPLPQALILTAIVIGFGVTAFMVVFFYRLVKENQRTEVNES
ncbi:Na(+)/H(+) antiporter subunit C [bacterium]|jgi:multicomponent Na+:H+ antiporter subunit C|nr:Na(+)/H(+) antiporter subunit C [bacterium]|tara:strand:+ start:1606 stop:1941 length:336 start_codon:yes stop_codon:yes gene_type:complete